METIQHGESKDSARRTLAYFLAEDKQYVRAEQIASDIQSDHDKAYAIKAIARSKHKNGDLDGALDVLCSTDFSSEWGVIVIVDFADELLASECSAEAQTLFHHARTTIRGMKHDRERSSAGEHLLYIYAKNGNIREFFDLLGAQFVDVFIRAVVRHAPMFDEIEKGLSIRIIAETTRIAGWVQPYWAEINQLLDQDTAS